MLSRRRFITGVGAAIWVPFLTGTAGPVYAFDGTTLSKRSFIGGATVIERFTDAARRVIILALEECRRFHHDSVGPEHLLLGLIRHHGGLVGTLLEDLGLPLESVRVEVEQTLARLPKTHPGTEIAFTPRAKRILGLSIEETRGYELTTVDLLHGLISDGESVAAKILAPHSARLNGLFGLRLGHPYPRSTILWPREFDRECACSEASRRSPLPSCPDFSQEREAMPDLREVARCAARDAEREALAEVLDRVNWNLTEASRIVKVSHQTLLNKISELGLGPAAA